MKTMSSTGASWPMAWMAVVTFVFYLVSGGKAYYLSGAIVPLLAAGEISGEKSGDPKNAAV